jgi:calcineurin-like phosphoesterase family protein
MSVLRFISDLHFGHENLAKARGFENADQMSAHIIERWNSTVKKRDITYILGDITMEKSSYYPLLNELLGIKKVLLGNHDMPQHVPELLKYVNKVSGMYKFKSEFGSIWLTHCPVHPKEMRGCKYNIHGHVHGNSLPSKKYINVCCEVVDYTPKLLTELITK